MRPRPHGRDADLDALVAASDAGTHVLLTGPRGVGRSAVLRAVGNRLTRTGRRVDQLAGTRGSRDMPLAALAPVLPSGDVEPELQVAATVRLLGAGPDRRTLIVDDVHLLDGHSLAVVSATAVQHGTPLLLSAPSGQVPDVVRDLVTDGHLTRRRLAPLEDVTPLLAAAGLDHAPVDEVLGVTGGLPRLVTAWIEDRVEGTVRPRSSPTIVGPAFVAAVHRHLDHLPAALVEALEVVAVGEPLAVDAALDLLGEAVADLEGHDLVEVRGTGPAQVLAVRGAGIGLALRTGLGQVRRRSLRRRVARAVLAATTAPAGARGHAAHHLLTAGVPPTAAVLTAAAADARDAGSSGLALELAHAALDAGGGNPARRVLGDALALLGHHEEAERVLATPSASAIDPASLRVRARNLAYGFDDPERALEVLRSATTEDVAGPVLADRALYATMLGDRDEVVATTDRLLGMDVSPPVRLGALVHRTLVDGLAGHVDAAFARLPEAQRLGTELGDVVPEARAQVMTNRVIALVGAARVDEALELVTSSGDGVWEGDTHLLLRCFNEAYLRHLGGDVEGGLAALDRAADAGADPFGLRGSLTALRVRISADAGSPDPDAVASVHGAAIVTAPRVLAWDAWARAVPILDAGTPVASSTALPRLIDAAARLDRASHRVWAAELLHLAVRRGHADRVLEDLEGVVSRTPRSPYVALLGRHARALVEADHEALLTVARSLAAGGVRLVAAEAAAVASAVAPAGPAARRAGTLAAALARYLRGAATPALRRVRAGLTDRELEVARLAPSRTSPEIGDVLHISTRTVDNHLHAAYRKLDLGGREDLADLLGPAAVPHDEIPG